MRLIDTNTGELKEYTGSQIPPYVALSHRWTDDEITFKDYIKERRRESLGWRKVVLFRKVARLRGVHHIWIDTVCIDKRSSSELSEAINSMYQWYANSIECYAYLSDVDDASDETFEQLRSSVWFTRGWTLQELVAPKSVSFYTSNWKAMGYCGHEIGYRYTKTRFGSFFEQNLAKVISEITSIPVEVFEHNASISSRKTAEKMGWLRNRTTTREEDMAYCALGLFGINMPLLYGEGSRAWNRLQEEIIRTSNDESIFAWSGLLTPSRPFSTVPILATSPSSFPTQELSRALVNTFPYTITNQGLELRIKAGTAYKTTVQTSPSGGEASSRDLLAVPLNSLVRPTGRFYFEYHILLLLSQPCGHYDRVLAPATMADKADDSPDLLQSEETVYVHTTAEMQKSCYSTVVTLEWKGAPLFPYTTYLDVDVEAFVERTRKDRGEAPDWTARLADPTVPLY